MSMSNAMELGHLTFIFLNDVPAAGLYEDIGGGTQIQPSTVDDFFHISLHTADPGEAGTQLSSEAAYGAYARVAVARDTVGWTVTANKVENAALVAFPQRDNAGSETLTHFGIGTDATGAGNLLYSAPLALLDSVPFTVNAAGFAAEDIVAPGHTFLLNDQVVFITVIGGTLPTGLTAGTVFHVITPGLTADQFRVSATVGGSAVNITTIGSGRVQEVLQKVVTENDTPQFAAGVLIVKVD